jgi:hypothetical protein
MENRNDIANELQAVTVGKWSISPDSKSTIVNENGFPIAETSYKAYGNFSRSTKEIIANAKLICEAVNNYQSLKESNAELIEAAELFLKVINRSPAALYHYGGAIELTEKALNKAKNI